MAITSRLSAIYARFWTRCFSLSSTSSSGKQTHFGFQTVDETEKAQKVHGVFENVANRYDLMNDVMSFGVHRFWKDRFVERLNPTMNIRLLDVAGGTGDVAFRVLRHIRYKSQKEMEGGEATKQSELASNASTISSSQTDKGSRDDADNSGSGCSVTVCDINQAMLDVGRQRARDLQVENSVKWVCGDAEKLPFTDEEFDAYTIAFGIRNCTHIDKVLQEAYRVLRRGGRLMCLEFSEVRTPVIRSVYDWYSFQVIPVMGQIFAADWNSYQYLVESIRQFPTQKEFASMIQDAGFRCVTYENLSCGVVAMHSAFKL